MGKIVAFFLNRPMLVNLSLIALLILGVYSTVSSRKEGFPEISLNRIMIQTIYPGASASDVETEVTNRIEEELQEVDGIKDILSYSEESVSRIEVRGKEELTAAQFRRLYSDIDDAINRIDDLPDGLRGRPALHDIKTSDIPVIEIAYTGEYKTLKPYLDDLKFRLRRIQGVAGTDVVGLPDEEVKVLVNAAEAKKRFVDLRMIAQALSLRNSNGSGGVLYTDNEERKITVSGGFENFKDILNTNVMANTEGYGVKLKEFATIEVGPEDLKLIVRNNGYRGATLTVRKSGSADLIDTVNRINDFLSQESLPEQVQAKILIDQSKLTKDRISLLIGNAIMGFILVLIVLVYYLDYKTAFWTAFGIPVALIGMIVFLRVFDISINLISLAGFIILLGMLVDNAIVIAEQYKTNREAGFSAKDAAIQAVDRMWAPVFASATTTMIAFAPLFMVSGFPGAFIWTIPLMVIVGLSVSLLENWFVLPLQLTYGQAKAQTIRPMKLEVYYRSTLKFFLRYRYSSLLVFVLILVLSLVSLRFLVRKDPFPQEAADSFSIAITLPVGMTAKLAEIEIGKIESLITLEVGDDLVGLSSRIGTQIEDSTTDRGIQSNLSILFVYLNSYEDRDRTANTIMQQLDTSLQSMATQNNMQYALNLQRIGPPMGKAIEVRILSDHDTDREEVASELLYFLQKTQGVSFVERDDRSGLKQTNLTLKQSLITSAGLRDHDILTSLRIALEGTIVTEMSNDDRKVRLKLNRMIHSVDELIKEIPVANRLGNLIHLDRFVSISESSTTATIAHVNAERSTTISGNIDNQITSPTDIMDIIQQNFKVKDGVRLEFAGQGVETNLIFADLASASIIAVFGIYLVIALIFNSYTKPIIIMLALPFMAFGLAFTLVSHNLPGSMMVGVAGIGLMGVVVNTSIVMVDTIHALAGEAALTNELVIEGAVSRLRPIFLSTTTTVLGVLPTGYGIGGYDPFLSHMSLVLAYGLSFATIITLIIVPIFFAIENDILQKWKRFRS